MTGAKKNTSLRSGAEAARLEQAKDPAIKWKRWGPYLSERQWGTVREDYSEGGDAWGYFPFEHAHLRAYRWGEDGLLGFTDNRGLVCISPAMWNGQDEVLKERLFGLTGPQGNHGEDVKELYYYLDSTPTHSYCKALYKYPQQAFPYAELKATNAAAGLDKREVKLWDLGAFDDDRYFDVEVVMAKANENDLLFQYTITNRGPEKAPITFLPKIFCRNTWAWQEGARHPQWRGVRGAQGEVAAALRHPHFGPIVAVWQGADELVFTNNESNARVLWGNEDGPIATKDSLHRYVVLGEEGAVDNRGSIVAGVYRFELEPGESRVIRVRFCLGRKRPGFSDFDQLVDLRKAEADEFFAGVIPEGTDDERALVMRQALAGMLWGKQYYHFDINRWLRGDPTMPPPPAARLGGRNRHWSHLYNSEVISMPDKWEYPWYAAWDSAFHTVALMLVDIELAKQQLSLFLREWYMHPNGQIPAYEWAFGDVNPPVQAWAVLRVYQYEKASTGKGDREFLESTFHKLMLNFTWWVNRKDEAGRNVFEGGFLGLDNIGVFDRSNALPEGGSIEQADATSWMGMYCLNLLEMSLELAKLNPIYQDVANKFFEHFLHIAHAINGPGGVGLWDDEDGFFYDVLEVRGQRHPLKVRSMVGLLPLCAVYTLGAEELEVAPQFTRRALWFLRNRPELAGDNAGFEWHSDGDKRLLSLVSKDRMLRIVASLLSEAEFLSPYGIRALSKAHEEQPYTFHLGGKVHQVSYVPAESDSYLFGGNSNWRGPVWFPVNYLLLDSLRQYHRFYGDSLQVEYPTGSGKLLNFDQVADLISERLQQIFLPDASGTRPVFGERFPLQSRPEFADKILFYEYFHGDSGVGLGAGHQTGWTGLVATLIAERKLP